VAQGIRRVSPDTITVGVFTIVGTVRGAFVGLLGAMPWPRTPPGGVARSWVLHARRPGNGR
jgi:hypothetical protein